MAIQLFIKVKVIQKSRAEKYMYHMSQERAILIISMIVHLCLGKAIVGHLYILKPVHHLMS